MHEPGEYLETILVVDDDPAVLRIVSSILGRAGFRVLRATDGISALNLATETPRTIQLLLSDVKMPGMSGPDLAETLKQTRPDIHVIVHVRVRRRRFVGAQLRMGFHPEAVRGDKARGNDRRRATYTR